MDTTIHKGFFRVGTFAGADASGNPVAFDAPVSVTFDTPDICGYADIDGGSGSFVGLAEGSTNYTATGSANGVTATVSGVITVAAVIVPPAPLASVSVVFGDEQPVHTT
jgi:hypothetical protein